MILVQETAGDPDLPLGAGPWWAILVLCVLFVVGLAALALTTWWRNRE